METHPLSNFDDNQKIAFTKVTEPLKKLIVHTQHAFIKIEPNIDHDLAVTDSKFSGTPFIPKELGYPMSANNQPLALLAQINFAQLHEALPNAVDTVTNFDAFPQQGLLQIFIDGSNDVYGIDFDDGYPNNDNYQVRFITDLSVETLTDIDDLVAKSIGEFGELTPVSEPCKLTFSIAYGTANQCEDVLENQQALLDLGLEYDQLGHTDEDHEVELYGLMEEVSNNSGHKMLGIPYFTQGEAREEESKQILLLQMDSDLIDEENEIMWGDSGIGNFFITVDQLKKLQFDKLLYNWDCL